VNIYAKRNRFVRVFPTFLGACFSRTLKRISFVGDRRTHARINHVSTSNSDAIITIIIIAVEWQGGRERTTSVSKTVFFPVGGSENSPWESFGRRAKINTECLRERISSRPRRKPTATARAVAVATISTRRDGPRFRIDRRKT